MHAHHSAKLSDPAKLRELQNRATARGLEVRFEPTVYVRNWPQASARPYRLFAKNRRPIGAYASLKSLEKTIATFEAANV